MNGTDFWKAFAVPLGLMVLFIVAFVAVFNIDKNFTKTPSIELVSGDRIVTDQAEVPVTGVVKETSKLSVNGKEVSVGTDGAFSTIVPVSLGENNVEIVAGNKTQAKTMVKITREEAQKAVAATATTNGADLTSSGPLETTMGSFGLTAILLALVIYRRSMHKNALQNA
jgi:hypothetical protein